MIIECTVLGRVVSGASREFNTEDLRDEFDTLEEAIEFVKSELRDAFREDNSDDSFDDYDDEDYLIEELLEELEMLYEE